MNKRIKELHTKATAWALDNYPPPVNTFMWEDLRNEKFAELIVRECADYISETATIETLLGERLKEHFGVE